MLFFRYVLIAATLSVFTSACAVEAKTETPEFLPVPKAFLGWWEPGTKADADIGVHIHPDGRLEYLCKPCNGDKRVKIAHYKVFHIAGPRDVYIAVFEPANQIYFPPGKYQDYYHYIRLQLTEDNLAPDIERLDYTDYNAQSEDDFKKWPERWNTWSTSLFWDDYQKKATEKLQFYSGGHYFRYR